MSSIKKIFPFIRPYKKYVYLNIFFNVFYALFSAVSFVALIPMLSVLFKEDNKITAKPVFEGIEHFGDYVENIMGYYITHFNETETFAAVIVEFVGYNFGACYFTEWSKQVLQIVTGHVPVQISNVNVHLL